MSAARAGIAECPGDQRSAKNRGEAELIAPGHEDPVRRRQRLEKVLAVAVLAGLDRQCLDAPRAEATEHFLVPRARIVQFGGRGDHGDGRVSSAAKLHEAREDPAVADLLLGATDGHDKSLACPVSRTRTT